MTPNAQLTLPMLPLRDIVIFPHSTMPLLAGRAKSLKACEEALRRDGHILLVAQKDPTVENPTEQDLYRVGTIAVVIQHLFLPDRKLKLLVQGERRAAILGITANPRFLTCKIHELDDAGSDNFSPQGPDSTGQFRLEDWSSDNLAGSPSPPGNHIAALQALLEDDSLGHAERLRRAAQVMGFNRDKTG